MHLIMFKKFLSILLVIMLVFSLVACNGSTTGDNDVADNGNDNTQTEQPSGDDETPDTPNTDEGNTGDDIADDTGNTENAGNTGDDTGNTGDDTGNTGDETPEEPEDNSFMAWIRAIIEAIRSFFMNLFSKK